MMKRVCVFCGSKPGSRPEFVTVAQQVGRLLADRGLGLVYGGGKTGLMGAVAQATLAAGGEVIGVIPTALVERELAFREATELYEVGSMHERKAMMADFADGFISLPGGFGTFEEFFEVLTWAQLGYHQKPVSLLNVSGYYDPLLTFFDHVIASGFAEQPYRDMILVDTDPGQLLDSMDHYQAPATTRWVKREEEL